MMKNNLKIDVLEILIDALEILKEAFKDATYFGVDRDNKGLCCTLDAIYQRDKVTKDQYNFLDDLIQTQANDEPYYWTLGIEGDNGRIAWIEEEIKKLKKIEDDSRKA